MLSLCLDVYDDMSTKNMAHKRKAARKARATVTFTDDMKVTLRKDNFLRTGNSHQYPKSVSYRRTTAQLYHPTGAVDVWISKTSRHRICQRKENCSCGR